MRGLDARSVANLILDECQAMSLRVTNLSLQKLVYFCHGWVLAKTGQPLVRHGFEAWQYGPVIPYLYRDFSDQESSPITRRAERLDPITGERQTATYQVDAATLEVIRSVLRFYGRLRPGTLVELSHAEDGPWHAVWNHTGRVNPGMKIGNDSIRKYFDSITAPF